MRIGEHLAFASVQGASFRAGPAATAFVASSATDFVMTGPVFDPVPALPRAIVSPALGNLVPIRLSGLGPGVTIAQPLVARSRSPIGQFVFIANTSTAGSVTIVSLTLSYGTIDPVISGAKLVPFSI